MTLANNEQLRTVADAGTYWVIVNREERQKYAQRPCLLPHRTQQLRLVLQRTALITFGQLLPTHASLSSSLSWQHKNMIGVPPLQVMKLASTCQHLPVPSVDRVVEGRELHLRHPPHAMPSLLPQAAETRTTGLLLTGRAPNAMVIWNRGLDVTTPAIRKASQGWERHFTIGPRGFLLAGEGT